jgi:hypothetical protein
LHAAPGPRTFFRRIGDARKGELIAMRQMKVSRLRTKKQVAASIYERYSSLS